MKIVYIVPGFGGTFYCGNCLRDSALAASLRAAGHEAILLPVYLPLVMNGEVVPGGPPVFYGAVSIYLKQVIPALRRMPSWLHSLLDSQPLLKLAARKSGSTRAHGLEGLTESMLLGEEGRQAGELAELVKYLKEQVKPDVVHLSNALLLGMAPMIRREAGVPVVCSLQDEDVWIDAMDPAARDDMWRLMARQAAQTDALVAVSRWFAGEMKTKMAIPGNKLHTVPIGVNTSRYKPFTPATEKRVIGYLSRLCEENGLAILVDAFILLKKEPRFADLSLRITGGSTGDDRKFIRAQVEKLRENGQEEAVTFMPEFGFPGLTGFFSGLSLLSVPVLKGEAFGLYLLEAMASGIPVVQPELGAFPEIIEITGGGKTYRPNDASSLAAAISGLLDQPGELEALSRSARQGVADHFDAAIVTSKLLNVYREVTGNVTSKP
ncbi:MAG TPA: glycosyltransferase family 4 protein [Bacteroidales bacterium]|nr:glycosyltransferase family 4 protein [Bacteroidales bacterium]HPS63016.1 glycosyltransferase family 4 protein [Bacteroidales bacterium]